MGRLGAAMRALARRRAYLAAVAAAGMLLVGVLVALLAFVALFVAALPEAWPVAPVGLTLALVLYMPVLGLALAFLAVAVCAVTRLDPPRPAQPGEPGLVTLREPRGGRLLGWRSMVEMQRQGAGTPAPLPPDHPLAAEWRAARGKARPPTRGARRLFLALLLAGIAAWQAAARWSPWGPAAFAVLMVFVVLAAALAAAVKGLLAGAWDRFLVERLAAEAAAREARGREGGS